MTAPHPAFSLPDATAQGAARPLRIALLGYRSHPHVGGQGIYLSYLATALSALGHRVDVISGPPYPELPPTVGLIRLPSLDLFAAPGHHLLALRARHLAHWADVSEWLAMATGRFGEPYSFGRRAYAYLTRHGRHYDVIHDNQSLSYGLLKLQTKGFPVVATIHHPITRDRDLAIAAARSALHRGGARRWYGFIRMQVEVARQLHHIVTVSEFSRSDIASEFDLDPSKIAVIKNGVDTSLFHPLASIAPIPYRLITTASSDQPLKGLGILLRALHLLRQRIPQAHLVVIGRIGETSANARLLQRLGLAGAVQFQSGLDARELNLEYNRAEVAVCPSLYEGFGLPAAEAMAAGRPVVSSDGGALAEVVADAGVLVPAGDSPALAAALERVLGDADLRHRLAQRGLGRILEGFSWRHAAISLVAYYRERFPDLAHANG